MYFLFMRITKKYIEPIYDTSSLTKKYIELNCHHHHHHHRQQQHDVYYFFLANYNICIISEKTKKLEKKIKNSKNLLYKYLCHVLFFHFALCCASSFDQERRRRLNLI